MKKLLISLLTMVITAAVFGGAVLGFLAWRRYAPSKERADLEEWFEVSGDEVFLFLDEEPVHGVYARMIDGQLYVRLDWVTACLNDRYYWSEEDHRLIYTLPEQNVYADSTTKAGNGSLLFIEREDHVWLLAELIQAYTDVRIERFTEAEVKRAFVDTKWEAEDTARVKKADVLRVKASVKARILTDLAEDETLVVLERDEKFSKVRTESGFIGYAQNRYLTETGKSSRISTFDAPVYRHLAMEQPVSLIWHQVTSNAANGQMEKLFAQTKGINVIAPTWFMLTDNEGGYHSWADRSYVEKAHARGLQVWAVVDNFNMGEQVQSEVLFASTKARRALIERLMEDAAQYGLDGINLDIEGIKPSAGPHYVQFVRELSVECRKQGVYLSVDTYVPSAYTAFYNRAELGTVCDYVVIMGYDEHFAGGDAGSVASLTYEREGIENTLEDVPAVRIVSGMPLYTRVWKLDASGTTSSAMGIGAAKKWVKDENVSLYWQEESGQYYGEKQAGDTTYCIWMEEEKSLAEKIGLVKEYGLAGAAYWKLGFDTAELWDVLQP